MACERTSHAKKRIDLCDETFRDQPEWTINNKKYTYILFNYFTETLTLTVGRLGGAADKII